MDFFKDEFLLRKHEVKLAGLVFPVWSRLSDSLVLGLKTDTHYDNPETHNFISVDFDKAQKKRQHGDFLNILVLKNGYLEHSMEKVLEKGIRKNR